MRELMRARFVTPLVSGRQSLGKRPLPGARRCGPATPGTEGEEALLDEISVMLLAGHETTASTLSWLAYELARHSEIQEATAGLVGSVSAPDGYWRGVSSARRSKRWQRKRCGFIRRSAFSCASRGGCDVFARSPSARQPLPGRAVDLHAMRKSGRRPMIHAGALAGGHTGAGRAPTTCRSAWARAPVPARALPTSRWPRFFVYF